MPDECFKPFIPTGIVSLTGKPEDQQLVMVMRDTPLSLLKSYPLRKTSACEINIIVRGIEMGFMPMPLHHINVKSNLGTEFFPVAMCSCSKFSQYRFYRALRHF